jgi:hypothetical protein|tara:strand:- start:597 stop:1535 length:939 start_codon:yes stop_codon:yes gene_type:complete
MYLQTILSKIFVLALYIFQQILSILCKLAFQQAGLFGDDFFAETLLVERSQLLNWAKKNVKQQTLAFKTIVENDKTLQKAGNKLNKLNNQEQRLLYEEIGNRIEQVALQHGELSDDLTKAAQLLKEGKRSEAEKYLLEAIDRAATRGDFRGIHVGKSPGTTKPQDTAPDISKKFEEEVGINNLFDETSVGAKAQENSAVADVVPEGIFKSIKDEVDKGAKVSTSPIVKSLSISQDLAVGSQRTTEAPPSSVFASETASPPSFIGGTKSSTGSKILTVGDVSDITDRKIYHKFDNINKIKELAKKNYPGYLGR